MNKPSLPQGMRDFPSGILRRRQFILDTARQVFESYAFEPLETPAMEQLETLTGKYGEEGDRLIFKVLNNGLGDPKNIEKSRAGFEKALEGRASATLTERALKYDLTIPFARFVAMNHGTLTFPHKRYQIQPVWRADRPQKGRYREFTQCDADIVGSRSLYNEADLCRIYHDVFTRLGLHGYRLMVNARQVLTALARACGDEAWLTPITVAIDKLEKAGREHVMQELREKGLPDNALSRIGAYLDLSKTAAPLEGLLELLSGSPDAEAGVAEMKELLSLCPGIPIIPDLTLARGLDYYTGLIFEVKAPEGVAIGSIGGGGRYDNLTGLFGVEGVPGVGISFGIDRIYDVMEALDLFADRIPEGRDALFLHMGPEESRCAFAMLQDVRQAGFSCDLYPDAGKMDKQLKYASKKGYRYAVIIGSREMAQRRCLLKHLATGTQSEVSWEELPQRLV